MMSRRTFLAATATAVATGTAADLGMGHWSKKTAENERTALASTALAGEANKPIDETRLKKILGTRFYGPEQWGEAFRNAHPPPNWITGELLQTGFNDLPRAANHALIFIPGNTTPAQLLEKIRIRTGYEVVEPKKFYDGQDDTRLDWIKTRSSKEDRWVFMTVDDATQTITRDTVATANGILPSQVTRKNVVDYAIREYARANYRAPTEDELLARLLLPNDPVIYPVMVDSGDTKGVYVQPGPTLHGSYILPSSFQLPFNGSKVHYGPPPDFQTQFGTLLVIDERKLTQGDGGAQGEWV